MAADEPAQGRCLVRNLRERWQEIRGPGLSLVILRALSALAVGTFTFALDVWIFKETGSYTLFALFAVLAAATGLLFGPIAGVLVDWFPRRRVIVVSDAAVALTAVSVAASAAWYKASLLIIGVAIVAVALSRTLSWPAGLAAITNLVPSQRRGRINGISETLFALAGMLSPPMGAAAFQMLGLGGVCAVTAVVSAACASAVSIVLRNTQANVRPQRPPGRGVLKAVASDSAVGFRWILKRADLLRLLFYFVIINVGGSIFHVAYSPYVLSVGSTAMLGACLGLGAFGTALGGILYATAGGPKQPERGILLGTLGLGACMLAFGITRSPQLLPGVAFLYGAFIPLVTASTQTIWQEQVPSDLQGRIFATRRMIAWAINPIAILLSIPLATVVFGSLLSDGAAGPTLERVWGAGTAGELGLMISTCGVLLIVVASWYLWRGSLRFEPRPSDVDIGAQS